MTDMQELLSRTTLKAVGTFLRSDENVLEWMLQEDVAPGPFMEGRRDNLKVALHRAKAEESGEVEEAVRELEDAAESWCAERISFVTIGNKIVAESSAVSNDFDAIVCYAVYGKPAVSTEEGQRNKL